MFKGHENDLISIIVPIYNVEKYLDKCLTSLVTQTYRNIEIILVDDGSPDKCGIMCDEWAKKDSRVKVIHKKNGGVSSARNVALEKVSGDYVCFVDGDDTVDENMIQLLYSTIQKEKTDIAICNFWIVNDDSSKQLYTLESEKCLTRSEALEEVLVHGTFTGSPWGKLFKTEKIKGLSFDEDIFFGEDLLFVVKAIKRAKNIVFISKACYNYFIRGESASTSCFNDKRFTDMISRQRIYEEISQMNDYDMTEIAHISIVIADVLMLRKLYIDKKARKKYCTEIKKSIKENFKLRRLKYLSFRMKIEVISICISCRLFFLLMYVLSFFR